MVQCSKLGSGRCVLIGDAAHNTPPAIGTGAASALQDTAVLADAVDALLAAGSGTEDPSATPGATSGSRSSGAATAAGVGPQAGQALLTDG